MAGIVSASEAVLRANLKEELQALRNDLWAVIRHMDFRSLAVLRDELGELTMRLDIAGDATMEPFDAWLQEVPREPYRPVTWGEVSDWLALLMRSGANTDALSAEMTEAACDGRAPHEFLLRKFEEMNWGKDVLKRSGGGAWS